jgi:hypothetical protein
MLGLMSVGVVAAAVSAAPVQAQGVRWGLLGGRSLVGGGDTRVAVDVARTPVSGGDQPGVHLRGFLEAPVGATPLSFQAELFFNQLDSRPNTWSANTTPMAQTALRDRAFGLMGAFTVATGRTTRVAPYFSLGAGFMATQLSTNPDPLAEHPTASGGGMGLGLTAGGGLRFRLGRPTLLVDWRYYQALNNTRGSAFMPFSLGLSF